MLLLLLLLLLLHFSGHSASTAQCDVTAKEGHVNYDISNVPVEARLAPTTGKGCHSSLLELARWRCVEMSENSDSVGHARALMAALPTPPRAIEGRRREVRSLGRGMGVLACLKCLA